MVSKQKSVIIIGDSTAMPRVEIPYNETWIYRLKNKFYQLDIIDKTTRGSTSTRLVTEGGGGIDLLEIYNPALIIIQMGITECAPRLFKKRGFEFFFINKILTQSSRKRYIRHIKNKRVRNPELTDVPITIFRNNLLNYCIRSEKINAKIIIILIAHPTNNFINKSPYIKQNIDQYNKVYIEMSENFKNIYCINPIDNNRLINDYFIDELHYNKKGFDLIYDKIINLLNSIDFM